MSGSTAKTGIPPAEVDVDENLVYRLLQAQHPDLAGLPIASLNNGWDNFIYRLGENLLVRLPRREMGARTIRNEQRYLPAIASRLPLPVSEPVRTGEPGCGYPWHWSISPWLAGKTADASPPAESSAKQWAEFLKALHVAGPSDGPQNSYRGVPLCSRQDAFKERFHRVVEKKLVDFEAVSEIWQQGIDAEPTYSPCWGHGDLHPMNILCVDGKFTGVIDWGDMYVGDVATDLASFFMLFPEAIVQHSLQHDYLAGDAQIQRAKASAVFFAVTLLDSGIGNSHQQVDIARRTFVHLGLPQLTTT